MSDKGEDDEWQPPTESEMKVLQARRERSNKISKLMGDYLLKGYKMLGVCCSNCDTILLQDKHGVKYCVACSELDADNVKDDPALSTEAALRQAAEEKEKVSSKKSSPTEHAEPLPGVGSISLPPSLLPMAEDRPPAPSHSQSAPGNLTEATALQESEEIFAAMGTSGDLSARATSMVSPDITRNTPRVGSSRIAQSRSCDVTEMPVQESLSSVRPRTLETQRSYSRRDHHLPRSPLSDRQEAITQALDVLYAKLKSASVDLQQTTDVRHCTDLCQLIKSCTEAIESLTKIQPHGGC